MAKTRSHFHQHRDFFTFLAKLSPKRQKIIIKGADKPILLALSEICLNLVRRNVPLNDKEKKLLRPFSKQIYQLSLKNKSSNQKKKLIQRGGLLGTLLTSILPIILSTVIGSATR